MGAAASYVLTTSFIITQPSLTLSLPSHRAAVMRKEPGQLRGSFLNCMFPRVRESKCMQVCICVDSIPLHHRAQLSRQCWKHRLYQRTLIGSAGDDELEVDEVEMN